MKVLMFTVLALRDIGGAEAVLVSLANALDRAGIDVSVVATRPDTSQSVAQRIASGIRLRFAPRLPIAALRTIAFRKVLAAASARFKPDILHCHDLRQALAAIRGIRRGPNSPLVLTVHTDVGTRPTRASRSALRRQERYRVALLAAEAVTVPSEFLAGQVRRFAPHLPAERIHVIPHGVETPDLSNATAGGPHPRRYVLAMGRLVSAKGFGLLISAFKHVIDRHCQVDLVIVGEGPEKAGLAGLAQQMGLEQRVVFPGVATGQQKAAWLRHAEIVIVPTFPARETFCLVALEAMAYGKAVLGTDSGALPELLDHGRAGHLVPAGNVTALAGAMDRLLADAVERDRLAAAARERAIGYSWDVAAGCYINLYQKLL